METKNCPYCSEVIRKEAKKCRFCGEILDAELKQERKFEKQSEPPPVVVATSSNSGLVTFLIALAIIALIVALTGV